MDSRINKLLNICKTTEIEVRNFRYSHNIIPYVKQIDTVAGEFPLFH